MTKTATDLLQRDARKNRVIVCEEMNFFWNEPELQKIAKMWKKCESIEKIGAHFKRDPDEVIFAIVHLARKDKIDRRKGGLLL